MPDVRLIDANVLKEKLQADHDFYVNAWGGFKNLPATDKARVDELTASIAAVVNAPTIDTVPVVHGRWELGIPMTCSACGKPAAQEGPLSFWVSDYCPNCGARMDAKEAEHGQES